MAQFLFFQRANSFGPPPHPKPPHPQKKKGGGGGGSFHGMTSHWLHGNSIPKIGCQYFWPRLIAHPKNTLPICKSNEIIVGTPKL